MGQKIHPKSTRLGYIQDWESRWLSLRDMPALIGEDFKIRSLVKERFRLAAVSWVGIERTGSYLRVNIHTARPGVVIGKKGADIESVRTAIEKITASKTFINVMEIKEPEMDARLVAEAIAMQLEKRVAHRRAIKRAMERTLQSGAHGIKVMVSGRLGGNEIARREWMREGRVPLHTFSADIDYGLAEAHTAMGLIGVKVWIFRKQLFVKSPKELLLQAKKHEAALAKTAAAAGGADAGIAAAVAGATAPAAAPAPGKSGEKMPDLPASALAQLEDVGGEEKGS
jgi:small subunit ribosomal protein S3